MNNIVTLSALINRLAKVANTDTNTSRRFLRTLFAAVEDQLAAGESVTVKGIGTFRRSQDPAFGNPGALQFIPDEQLAAEINAPFAMFNAVELADGVSFKELEEPEPMAEPEPEPQPAPVAQPEPVSEPEPAPVSEPVAEPEPQPEANTEPEPAVHEPQPKPAPKPEPKPEPVRKAPLRWPEEEEEEETVEAEENVGEEIEEEYEERRRFPWWFWLVIALLLLGGAAAGYYAAMSEPSEFEEEETIEETADSINTAIEEVAVADLNAMESAARAQDEIIPDAPAQPEVKAEEAPAPAAKPEPKAETKPAASNSPVYDTVTVSLAKLAKKHYGNTNYWVFIYKANEDKLGNPDHISRGTKVLIPARESFQGANNEETKAKAGRLAAEINRKYRK